jgi:pimeloyl-ACP methyl ester carboxylesterase
MAADLHGLLAGLGIERAHLVGFSFGGTVALHCAVLYPSQVASLVLAEPWIAALRPLVGDLRDWPHLEATQAGLKERGLSIPVDKWLDMEYIAREALHAPVRTGLRQGMARNSRRIQQLSDRTSALKEVLVEAGLTMHRIAEVRQPTMAVYGEMSPFLQIARQLRETMPSCRVAVLKDVGHMIPLLKPDLFVTSVTEFLHGLDGAGASTPSGGARRSAPDADPGSGRGIR